MILVTGGAGFIGANFVLDWLSASDEPVINLDALTYAGNLETLSRLQGDPRHVFVHGDICDRALVDRLFAEHKPRAVVHFAAESHVDRSIHGPAAFVRTNGIEIAQYGNTPVWLSAIHIPQHVFNNKFAAPIWIGSR